MLHKCRPPPTADSCRIIHMINTVLTGRATHKPDFRLALLKNRMQESTRPRPGGRDKHQVTERSNVMPPERSNSSKAVSSASITLSPAPFKTPSRPNIAMTLKEAAKNSLTCDTLLPPAIQMISPSQMATICAQSCITDILSC